MLVQCALFLVAVLVLVGKRQREVPRRPLRVWAMDSSKQCAGAGLAHVANMAVATLLARENGGGGGGSGGSDECAFYAVNFFFDVTAGVLLVWGLLQGLERCAATQDKAHTRWPCSLATCRSIIKPSTITKHHLMESGCKLERY